MDACICQTLTATPAQPGELPGELGLARIEPGSTYMKGSTGPLRGARLLFGEHRNPADLDGWVVDLNAELNVGMQVLEDALCNWQKSPAKYKRYTG